MPLSCLENIVRPMPGAVVHGAVRGGARDTAFMPTDEIGLFVEVMKRRLDRWVFTDGLSFHF
jgi:hypothetical protein